MLIFNSGKGIEHLRDNIVLQYSYFGLFWIFCLTYEVKFYEVTGPENYIVRELTSAETGIEKPWSRIPFMKRFGLLVFIVLITLLCISSNA